MSTYRCACPASCQLHPPGTSGGAPKPLPKAKSYPEHEKLAAVQDKSQAIGEFIDWLQSEYEPRVVLAQYHYTYEDSKGNTRKRDNPILVPTVTRIEALLAAHFEIDLVKIEREKREMLAEMRGTK